MRSAYKFRIYPTKQQAETLDDTLDFCRQLWNLALADRKTIYELEGKTRSYEDQAALLTQEKTKYPELKQVFSQVLQEVLRRLQTAFDNFFRRVRQHARKKGYPRFKSRYLSFTYPQLGFKLDGSKLILAKIGSIRIFRHRGIEGQIKTCTLKKSSSCKWFALFSVEKEDPHKVEPLKSLGVDLGLTHQVVTSEGQYFKYPNHYIKAQKALRKAQKALSRKAKGSNNRQKAKIKVAKVHERIKNLRDESLHQVSRKLVDQAELIVFENLNINEMVQGNLAKHILDHSWNKLIQFTQSKAERAGKTVVLVDPRNTTKKCSACGKLTPKTLKDRVHSCRCGLTICRDLNAALNILTLGQRGGACGDLTSILNSRSRQVGSMKQEAPIL
ncbi:MAG: transposase [Methanotrichaceae archaeon]|nr:transposase [Methanotrichaceae archaeon]